MSAADAELVERALAGERAAYEALVATHLARAQAVARSVLGDQAAVDDVVQDSFLRAYDRLGQLVDGATFPSWLCAIVRNEAVSWVRRNGRSRTVSIEHAELPAGDGAADAAERPELERLRGALTRLPADYREILALKYEAGCDYQKIAETLGTTLANVEKRLYRARQALLKLMAR